MINKSKLVSVLLLGSVFILGAKEKESIDQAYWDSLNEFQKNRHRAIEYFEKKYKKSVDKTLEDLKKEKIKYEKYFKSSAKKSKKILEKRKKEYQLVLDKIKAQKIFLLYPKIYKKMLVLESYEETDMQDEEGLQKLIKLENELRTQYTKLSEQKFPDYFGEYAKLKKKKDAETTKRRAR